MSTFSTNDVSKVANVTLRQLQWWDEKRLVSPRHAGHRRVYDATEVLEVLTIAALKEKSLSLQQIRTVLRGIQKEVRKRFSCGAMGNCYLLTDGAQAVIEQGASTAIERLKHIKRPAVLVSFDDLQERYKSLTQQN